jgi:signal transduction histidine kinase/CheY-like chemotaxis protein/HAMP domain-containing protein
MDDARRQQSGLDEPGLEQLLASLTAVRDGDFSMRLPKTGDPLLDQIAVVFNGMVEQLDRFTTEVTRVAREVGTEGKLGGQAEIRGVSGTWKSLTESVNAMASNLTSQVRNIAQVTTAVANGDLTKKIDVDAQGEILELKTTINTMVDQLSSFAAEVTRVAREVGRDGQLGGQAEVEGVAGTWKRLTENVNELAQNLTRQVRAIAGVTSAVAAGDLTRSISVEAKGEVAELKDNINSMVVSLRETIRANEEQNWLKTNLARIGGMMQGHRDLAVVADLVMEELTPLVQAQHGTFFVAEEDAGRETRLRLVAGYGLRADKDAPIQYRIGQSLIGQVAKSKRPIVVDEIPPGYIKISSGLGEASPANLAVLPLLFEGQVLGVVELASFTKFTPVQVSLLEQLTETLGVNVNAIVATSRTDALLKESQRLTAELQARSAELQARSEELQASNADLEAQAAVLAAQKRDIETKNAEIERARQEIEERARQLALASQYKSQFLANMSHELRTPLNSLLILARLLTQNPGQNLTPKQVEYAHVIHSAGSDLLNLINDILDLSKVEAGRMDLRVVEFPLQSLIEDIQATFQPLTAERSLDFTVVTDPAVPRNLVTDRQRLRQVLSNLVSNAVKFTERGGVTLRVVLADGRTDPHGGPVIAFVVTDTGIGIAPEDLTGIFGAFQQGDGTLSRRYGGTGLGLSIAREVAALLGGEITAESEAGLGSTFTLHLPSAPPPTVTPAGPPTGLPDQLAPPATMADPGAAREWAAPGGTTAPARGPLEARNLLVLEGTSGGLLNLLAHSAVSDLADGGPVSIATVATAADGITALTQAPFQCVVVDLSVPSAPDFLDQVTRKAELRGIPILARARQGQPGGADERLDLAGLREKLGELELLPSLDKVRERIAAALAAAPPVPSPATAADPMTRAPAARASAAPAPAAPVTADAARADAVRANAVRTDGVREAMTGTRHAALSGRKALVVDDDPRNVFAIASTLRLSGMSVLEASSGQAGINVLITEPDIDVILMDIMMPGMDGYATMSVIRQMPDFARLPIIAVTARAMLGDREKSIAAGASDYVTKPVDPVELLSSIERWLVTARS